jgi:outer membrane biosynthesis protein TonB
LKQESQQRAIQQAAANITTAMAAATSEAATAQKSASVRVARPVDSAPEDYRYVKADLRRIGVLAVSFTAILIVLSFFIR